MDYKAISKDDMDFRMKWNGLLSRFKRTPGKFMMRLRTSNGITNSDLFRLYADSVEPYGDIGVSWLSFNQCLGVHMLVRAAFRFCRKSGA